MTDYDDVTAAAAAGGWLTYAEGHTGDVSFEGEINACLCEILAYELVYAQYYEY